MLKGNTKQIRWKNPMALIKSSIRWSVVLWKRSDNDIAEKYCCWTALKWLHSSNICCTVRRLKQNWHSGGLSLVRRYECVALVWPIWSLLLMVPSWLRCFRLLQPTTGFTICSLLLTQESHWQLLHLGERLLDFRSSWIVFIHILRLRPTGLLQFSKGKWLRSSWHLFHL